MYHTDFHIGLEFFTATGRWRCTDVGTRTVIAIRLDAPDDSWYNGPPYAVAEVVLDENDLGGTSLVREEVDLDATPDRRPGTHPGEMLREEFLVPLGLSGAELAQAIGVSVEDIDSLLKGERGITPDLARRLGIRFDTSEDLWLDLQSACDQARSGVLP